jgi:hypothetical protein
VPSGRFCAHHVHEYLVGQGEKLDSAAARVLAGNPLDQHFLAGLLDSLSHLATEPTARIGHTVSAQPLLPLAVNAGPQDVLLAVHISIISVGPEKGKFPSPFLLVWHGIFSKNSANFSLTSSR